MKKYNNISEVWADLDEGKTIHWTNDLYKIYISDAYPNNEYQSKHFTNRKGHLLSARCISNYFGSLLDESELSSLYSKD